MLLAAAQAKQAAADAATANAEKSAMDSAKADAKAILEQPHVKALLDQPPPETKPIKSPRDLDPNGYPIQKSPRSQAVGAELNVVDKPDGNRCLPVDDVMAASATSPPILPTPPTLTRSESVGDVWRRFSSMRGLVT